jgi:allantoinase
MSDSGAADFPRADDLTLYEGMCEAAALGVPVAVHAESEAITAALRARATGHGMRDWAASRPPVAETEAIARAIELAAVAGCSLHVVHVSTARGVELCRAAGVTCEVTAHHLLLDEDEAVALGAVAKCAPPLRARAEVDRLWEAVRAGDVTCIVSDHSPAPSALRDEDDLFASWGGIGGGQSTLELVADALEPAALAPLLAGNAAARFGLARKGRLEVGFDADLVMVDVRPYTLTAARLRSRHKVSPYVGRTLGARVVRTLLRGAAPTAGRGRLQKPSR